MQILERILHRLGDCGIAREMNNGCDVILLKGLPDQLPLCQITFHQRSPFDRPAMPRTEIIEHHGLIAGVCERLTGVAADIPSSTRDENILHPILLRPLLLTSAQVATRATDPNVEQ